MDAPEPVLAAARSVLYLVPGVVRFYDTNSLPCLVPGPGLTIVECNGGPGAVTSWLARNVTAAPRSPEVPCDAGPRTSRKDGGHERRLRDLIGRDARARSKDTLRFSYVHWVRRSRHTYRRYARP